MDAIRKDAAKATESAEFGKTTLVQLSNQTGTAHFFKFSLDLFGEKENKI